MKFINYLSKTALRRNIATTILCIFIFISLMSIIVWAADINIPNTFNKVYLSDVKTLTFTSADIVKSITINGEANTDTIICTIPNFANTPTAVLGLVNSATQTYYESSSLANNSTNAITISKPIKGVTSAVITLSTAAGSEVLGQQDVTLQFYFSPNPSR